MINRYLILSSYTVILFVTALWRAKWRFSPVVAFYATWSGSLILLYIGQFSMQLRWPQISADSAAYLMAAIAGPIIGAAFAEMAVKVLKGRREPPPRRDLGPPFRLTVMQFGAYVSLAATVFYLFENKPDLSRYIQFGDLVRDEVTAENSALFNTIAIYAALTIAPAVIVGWFLRIETRFWMWFPFAAIAVLSFTGLSKFAILLLVVYYVNAVLFTANVAGGGRRIAIRITTAGVILLSSFVITGYLRRSFEAISTVTDVNPVIKTVYDYSTGYIPAFGEYYDEYRMNAVTTEATGSAESLVAGFPGKQTFSGIYRTLAAIGVVRGTVSNHYEGSFNVYTVLRDLIMDFGPSGAIISMAVLGFFATFVYTYVGVRSVRGIILVSLITLQMEFALMYSLFGFVFYYVIILLAPLMGRNSTIFDLGSPPANRDRRDAHTVRRSKGLRMSALK